MECQRAQRSQKVLEITRKHCKTVPITVKTVPITVKTVLITVETVEVPQMKLVFTF